MKRDLHFLRSGKHRLFRLTIIPVLFFFQAASAISTTAISDSVSRKVKWSYGGYVFTTDLKFSYSDYRYYHGLSKLQAYSNYASEGESHQYLRSLAAQLDVDAATRGYTNSEMAGYLVAFVQQAVPYVKDPANLGHDYPRYPIETIVEKGGDCEDKAALLASLLNTFGFDAVMIELPGHMAVGLWSDRDGYYYLHNKKHYSYIETTGIWDIGDIPSKYRRTQAVLIDLDRPARFVRGQLVSSVKTKPAGALSGNSESDPQIGTVPPTTDVTKPGRKKAGDPDYTGKAE